MKVAVVGCSHGSLDEIYRLIAEIEAEQKITVSLLLICGDFQSLRNPSDFECLAVPPKYREMGTFHRYYSGKTQAPVLTIFIGGNHEASNYLQELPFGGWVAPGIYYLGLAGVVRFGGLRIAGMSGIFKSNDFGRGHYETLPFGESEKRSIYHVRSLELFRLKLLSPDKIDVFLTHDWPRGIWQYGNVQELLRWKPFFRQDIDNGVLGSPPAEELLHHLRPRFYFAGHMHCRFGAKVPHNASQTETSFLALDKVLPRRRFLEIVDIPTPSDVTEPPSLELDPEWLCILKSTSLLWSYYSGFSQLPTKPETVDAFKPTEQQMQDLAVDFGGELALPNNFEKTAPIYEECNQARNYDSSKYKVQHYLNPQTALLCQMLEIDNPNVEWGRRAAKRGITVVGNLDSSSEDQGEFVTPQQPVGEDQKNAAATSHNPDEIVLSDDEDNKEPAVEKQPKTTEPAKSEVVVPGGKNPDEIELSFDDDADEITDQAKSDEPSPKKVKPSNDIEATAVQND